MKYPILFGIAVLLGISNATKLLETDSGYIQAIIYELGRTESCSSYFDA
jgi:hypothetical protein